VPHLAGQAIFNSTQKLQVLHSNFMIHTEDIDLDMFKKLMLLAH